MSTITQATPLARAVTHSLFLAGHLQIGPGESKGISACIDVAITEFFDSGPADQATWLRMAVAGKRVESLETAIRNALSCPTDIGMCKRILREAIK